MFESNEKIEFGELVKVKISNALEYDLVGEITK